MDFRKIMKVVRDQDNEFKMNHLRDKKDMIVLGFCGNNDFGGNVICLNMIDVILPTLVHELLHGAYPDENEGQIKWRTKKLVSSLTRRQRKKLFLEWMCRISEKEVEK